MPVVFTLVLGWLEGWTGNGKIRMAGMAGVGKSQRYRSVVNAIYNICADNLHFDIIVIIIRHDMTDLLLILEEALLSHV